MPEDAGRCHGSIQMLYLLLNAYQVSQMSDVGGCHGCTYMQWMYSDALVVVKCLPGVLDVWMDAGRCHG